MIKILTTFLLLFVIIDGVSGQTLPKDLYLRSSLHMVLLESDNFPQKDLVMKSWTGYPFPDKYDKHGIEYPVLNPTNYSLSDDDLKAAGYLKEPISGLPLIKAMASGKKLRYSGKDSTTAFALPSEREEIDLIIKKAMKKDFLANLLLKKWHGIEKGSQGLGFEVMKKRANYNATNSDIRNAEGAINKLNAVMNPGLIDQLISNTFVTFTRLNFYENEPVARAIKESAVLSINNLNQNELAKQMALKAAELAYQKTKDGYTLISKTWLYQLHWNDSVKAHYYEKLALNNAQWNTILNAQNAELTPDQMKFISEDPVLQMNFVNDQVNSSTFLFAEGKTLEQIVDKVLVRNLDNAFAELQKENDVFKPVVKILNREPLTAEIGMKEGLEGGEKFEVLELQEESGTGKILYKSVSTVKVQKGKVWDNRYNAGEKAIGSDGSPLVQEEFTTFSGSAKNGTFLRLIK